MSKGRNTVYAFLCAIFLAACGGQPQPTPDPNKTATPIQLDGTRTPDQVYLFGIVDIQGKCLPYYDKLTALLADSNMDIKSAAEEWRTGLDGLYKVSLKFREIEVPRKFKDTHEYLIAYSDDIRMALAAFDRADMLGIKASLEHSAGQLQKYTAALKKIR